MNAFSAKHLLAAGLFLLPLQAVAQKLPPGSLTPSGNPQDQVIKEVGLDQKMNAPVPLDLLFQDETGKAVILRDYFGSKPVMLVLIQYRCTMLCTHQLETLIQGLKELKFTPGKEFTLLTVSIDPRETPELASAKKQSCLEAYGRPEAAAGWHFLTGQEAAIKRLAASIGFRYAYDAKTDQFAHPDGVILLTPQGKTARYFFRLHYPAQGLRFGLIEAAQGKIGTPLDAIALLCYHYNPATGKYGLVFMNVVRLAAIATVLLLAMGIAVMQLAQRRWPAAAKSGALLGPGAAAPNRGPEE